MTSCSDDTGIRNTGRLPLRVLNFLKDAFNENDNATVHSSHSPPSGDGSNIESVRGGPVLSVQVMKSAQQRVWTVTVHSIPVDNIKPTGISERRDSRIALWKDALLRGGNRLVVREWRGASRWWNVNHPVDLPTAVSSNNRDNVPCELSIRQANLTYIAQQEVWGYQSAREAFQSDAFESDDPRLDRTTVIRIPQLLHFESSYSHEINEPCSDDEEEKFPWALWEYVGPESTVYDVVEPDDSWTTLMVPVRCEFGFTEPHPRWGRVPEPMCLEYAMMVLRSVILPIHRYYFACATANVDLSNHTHLYFNAPIQYCDMVDLYQPKLDSCLQAAQQNGVSIHPLDTFVPKLRCALERLHEAKGTIEPMPSVLCHMDYQPQNLCFARMASDIPQQAHESHPISTWITSVLDWEEAAFADPRFDLLMLCRKVCCNRQQAEELWQSYTTYVIQRHPALLHANGSPLRLGPIEPWLALETVHSITTLLLQPIAGGGRNSWESQVELWDKIDREYNRLENMGWAHGS